MISTNSKFIFVVLLSTLSNGCAHDSVSPDCASVSANYSPVSTHYSDTAQYEPEYYLVKKDDTLYAISRLFGLDYRQLARWNQIDPPSYSIEVGQKIRLSEPTRQNNPVQSHTEQEAKLRLEQ
ncbi:LysM peptidoglycan-binding domain-containing protein [Methylobacter sp.]|uniref:LysM peptidoglycan-binding domain-containing protein n=1 Tax=Methylobacter sp. TaxID=2051955 RepID=UPI002FDE1CA6